MRGDAVKRPRDEWEINEDVRTLERAQNIRRDPERLKDAQDQIRKTREAQRTILGMKPVVDEKPVYRNKATLGRLSTPNRP